MTSFFRLPLLSWGRGLLTAWLIAAPALHAADEPKQPAPPPLVAHELPIRALMLYGLPPPKLEQFLDFVRTDLPREGVNCLIFQIDYHYEFKSRPELIASNAYSEAQIKSLVAACREAGVKLIPLVNCLGHQSWAENTHKLLTVYPELDETPGLYPNNKDIYCRSYCPNHPKVHEIMFDVLGEIVAAFEADALHVGMDEVFLIGEDACPRCRGADKAELFAQEVRTLRDFLHTKNARLWIWGDRFLDGRATGLGKWEASMNHTHRAIDLVPKDIVICDWHYDAPVSTPVYFAMKGFEVVICSFNKPEVATAEAEQMVALRAANAKNKIGSRLLGVMSTCWGRSGSFVDSYRAAKTSGQPADPAAVENFIRLFERVRALQTTGALASSPK